MGESADAGVIGPKKGIAMKIKATVASTFKDYENGWSYSKSALMELAESAKNIPVIFRKNKIGTIEFGKYENSKVIIVAEIEKTEETLNKKLFLVPGGLTDFETTGDIIQKCIVHQFFLTENPSDKTLTTFEII